MLYGKQDGKIYTKDSSGAEINIGSVASPYIYVDDVNGNDSNGGYSTPFKTLNAAVDAAVDGDLIWVKKGDYHPTSNLFKDGVIWYFDEDSNIYQDDIYGELFLASDYGLLKPITIGGKANFILSTVKTGVAFYLHTNVNVNIEFNTCNTLKSFFDFSGTRLNNVNIRFNSIRTTTPIVFGNVNNIFLKGNECLLTDEYGVELTTGHSIILDTSQGVRGIATVDCGIITGLGAYFYGSYNNIKSTLIRNCFIWSNGTWAIINANITNFTYGNDIGSGNVVIHGNILTLNMFNYNLYVIGNIYEVNQTGGILTLTGTILSTLNKTGGQFNGRILGYESHTLNELETFNIGFDDFSKQYKFNVKGSSSRHPLGVFDSDDNEIFSILNQSIVKIKETTTDPIQLTGFVQLFADTYGKFLMKDDNGNKQWLNAIKEHTPNVGDMLGTVDGVKYVNNPTKDFDLIYKSIEPLITSNQKLNTQIPVGYKLYSLVSEEGNSGDVTNLCFGSSSGASDIAGPNTITADAVCVESTINKSTFNSNEPVDIYVSGIFGTGSVTIFFTFIKIK